MIQLQTCHERGPALRNHPDTGVPQDVVDDYASLLSQVVRGTGKER